MSKYEIKEPIVKTFSGLRFWVDGKVLVDDPKRVMEYMLDVYENYEAGNKTHEAIAETVWQILGQPSDGYRKHFLAGTIDDDGLSLARYIYEDNPCICHDCLEDILNDNGCDWMEELA